MRLRRCHMPTHFWIGIALVAIAWPLAWAGPMPLSGHTFFPLWLGYILAVDGITTRRTGTSLISRDRRRFVLLFVFSVPLWWLFEIANELLGNWRYISAYSYPTPVYLALASLSFSTVMPAIFVTAEFWRSTRWFGRTIRWARIDPTRTGMVVIALLGLGLFAGSLAFPDVLFPFVWIGPFLFLDVINALTGGKSISVQLAHRRWDTFLVLFAAGLTCGFFWEMWNVNSLPKWVYEVPHVGFLKIFEMPILGYGGYFPFALEVYASYHLLHTVVFRCPDAYLHVDRSR